MTNKLKALLSSTNAVVRANAGIRTDGKVASARTQEHSEEFMAESCRRLHRLGYYLEDISGLQGKHIEALVKDWHTQGLSNKTMQNQLSRLRVFCNWLGRPNLVKTGPHGSVAAYLPHIAPEKLRVKTYTQNSKSWSALGIDVDLKIREALANDQRHGVMLMLSLAFGLRKKEHLLINPWNADKNTYLEISDNIGKSGRYRQIQLEDGQSGIAQRWALDQAKKICRKNEALGWPGLNFQQCKTRHYHYMQKLGITKFDSGITGHGARAEYAENLLILRGLMPPSLGGKADQMPKAQREAIILDASNKLGHNRLNVLGAYVGSFRPSLQSGGKGERLCGLPIITADGKVGTEIVGIYVNPAVRPDKQGNYRCKSLIERQQSNVVMVVEGIGTHEEPVDMATFIGMHPQMAGAIAQVLIKVGLGD